MSNVKAIALNHSPEFRKRRALNWLTLGFTYAAMYMGRYNLGMANVALSLAYGWDKTQVGAIVTSGLTIYGFSAIINGPIADKIGGRRDMLMGSIGTVVFNFLFGLGGFMGFLGTGPILIAYLSSIWAMNSYFQSYSALALIKVNAGWFHVHERGIFSAIFGSMIQSGRYFIFIIGGYLVATFSWPYVFFIPSLIVAVMSFLTFLFVRNAPEDVGLPELDVQDASSGDTGPVTLKYVLKKVFTNPVAITIAAAEFCTGFVRHGFEQWFPRYMVEVQKMPLDSTIFKKGAGAVVIAGILGAFAAGVMSDLVFKHRRPPVAFIGYVLQVICLVIIWQAPSMTWVIVAFTVNSFAISMVHSMLSGTASMDFGGKKAAGTAAGIFDGMQYIGGAFTGIGLGWLLDKFGWTIWGPSMIAPALIGGVLMAFLWNARPKTGASAH